MKSNKTAMGKTQAVDGNGVHKAADKSLSKQVKTQSGQRRNVLDVHVPHGLDDRTGEHSTYPAGSEYLALVECLKKKPYRANHVQLGRHILVCMRALVKHQ